MKSRNPSWAGLDDRVNRVLFTEGRRALVDGDDERGLRLLRELLGRKRDYPGLLDQIAEAYGKRIDRALRMGLYVRGRRVLRELAEVTGEHAAVRASRAVFVARATERLKQGESASPAERLDALTDALRIWPTLPGAEEKYIQAFQAEPTLDVGVTDVAWPLGPWVHSRADARLVRLLYRPVLATDDQEARQGKRPGQLAASVETTDLGRRLLVKLKPGPAWSDGSRPVSAIDVAHSMIERSDPHSPSYEARWADLLDRVEVRDEMRVELRLNHAAVESGRVAAGSGRPGARRHRRPDRDLDEGSRPGHRRRLPMLPVGRRRPRAAIARRPIRRRIGFPERPPSAGDPDVSRVGRRHGPAPWGRQHDRPCPARPGGIALRDVRDPGGSVFAACRPRHRDRRPQPRSCVAGPCAGACPTRWIARGCSRRPCSSTRCTTWTAPADGPFPKGSYADATAVQPLGFNIMLAKMLVAAARKDLGGRPIRLTFEYPAIPECRTVVVKLAEAFRIAGVEIEPIEVPESRLESELRAGRRFDLAYRVLHCDDPIQDAGTLLCPAYDAPPESDPLASAASPRILQLLLQLERAGEWPTARGLATQIDRESRDELAVIPLWQLADHYAWRSRLRGPARKADQLYHHLEEWEISPWIARDPWDTTQDPKAQ